MKMYSNDSRDYFNNLELHTKYKTINKYCLTNNYNDFCQDFFNCLLVKRENFQYYKQV